MKKTATLLFLASSLFAGAQNVSEEDEAACLVVSGIAVSSQGIPVDGVDVRLLCENEELEWVEVTSALHHDHTFHFTLQADHHYTLEISKDGYLSRRVSIDTRIPAGTDLSQKYRYEFEIEMLKEKKVKDDFYLDFPVALIEYDKGHDIFSFSAAYTNHIKERVRQTAGYTSRITTREF